MADGDYCGDEGLECCGGENVVCDRFCIVLCSADGDPCADVEGGGGCNECIDEVRGTAAPTVTSVTILNATCHANVGADIFDQCHDNVFGGIGFSIAGIGVTPGSDGVATVGVGASSVTVVDDEASFVKYLGALVFCSEQSSGDVRFTGSAEAGLVTFDVADGDVVICDWYNITAATAPDDDDIVRLPTTGIAESGSRVSSLLGVALAAAAAAYLLGRKLRATTTAPTE